MRVSRTSAAATPSVGWRPGLALAHGGGCPFCGNGIAGNDLVAAYKACFSAAYQELSQEVAGLRRAIEQAIGPAAVAGLEAALAQNAEAFAFWSRYCDVGSLHAIDVASIRVRVEAARDAALALAEQKGNNLLTPVPCDGRQAGRPGLEEVAAELSAYNAAVVASNAAIEAKRCTLQGVGVPAATAAVEALRRRKHRFANPVKKSL